MVVVGCVRGWTYLIEPVTVDHWDNMTPPPTAYKEPGIQDRVQERRHLWRGYGVFQGDVGGLTNQEDDQEGE